ncbi:MAG: VWA domain-containing protein [Bacteroidales bacterium]|nr:VWA domain-containing protein [Bacteroidales bacterium]
MMKKLILLLFLTATLNSSAQTFLAEKRIYLLDVTASMTGKGVVKTPDIFSDVKSQLTKSLDDIDSQQTEIVIVPFTDIVHRPITGLISQKDSLAGEISKIKIQVGDTNIADAWNYGISQLDSTKVNYLFLLTDGLHNCGVSKDSLYHSLSEWQYIAKDKYMFAFYVMLTPNAKEMEIIDVIDSTDKLWPIESMNVNVSFVNSGLNLKSNINDNKTVRIDFTSQNRNVFDSGLQLKVDIEDNPYYQVHDCMIDISRRYAEIKIEELAPRIQIPVESHLKLYLKYDKEKYPLIFFTPEIIDFHIVNRGVRTMTIREK